MAALACFLPLLPTLLSARSESPRLFSSNLSASERVLLPYRLFLHHSYLPHCALLPYLATPTTLPIAPTVLTQSSPPLRSVDYFYEILNRDAKRILVSHLRTWEERKEAAPKAAKKAAKAEEPALDLPKVEKTTLGDLSALAELKASLEAEAKPAKAAKAEPKAEEPAEEKPAKKAAAKKTAKKDAE